MLFSELTCASHCLAVQPHNSTPVKTHKLTLAHHRVSSSTVVKASNQITEGCGFRSHLGLRFFQSFCSSMYLHLISCCSFNLLKEEFCQQFKEDTKRGILFALLLDSTVIFNRYVIVMLITTLSHHLLCSYCRTPRSQTPALSQMTLFNTLKLSQRKWST